MRKILFLLLFIPALCFSQEKQQFEIKSLEGGMWSNPSSNKIPDNSAELIQNFYTDIETLAIERNGYEKRDSTVLGDTKPVSGLWEFVDNSGQQWIISFSSRTFYRNLIGNTPTAFGLVASVDTIPQAANNLGKIWFVNGTDYMWWFNGTSTGTVATAPLGRLIVAWRERIVISNVPSFQSTVYFSEDGDGTNWALGGNPTDPFTVNVGGANDGFNVTCMWSSYIDTLIISRKKDLHGLSGFDQSDVELREISSEIGCIQCGSMREFDGSLLFLSNRGMEEMRGITIRHISEPIRNLTDVFIKNTSQERRSITDSEAQWEQGTIDPPLNLTTSELSGSLANKTTVQTETIFDLAIGTVTDNLIYADTITAPGQIQTTFPDLFSTTLRDGGSGTKLVYEHDISAIQGSPTLTDHVDTNGGELNVHGGSLGGNFDVYNRTVERTHDVSNGTTFYFKIVDSIAMTGGSSLTFPRSNPITDPQADIYFVINAEKKNTSQNAIAGTYWYAAFFSTGSTGSPLYFAEHKNNDDGTTNINTSFTMPITVAFWLDSSNYQFKINGSVVDSGAHTWTGTKVYPHFFFRWCCSGTTEKGAEFDDFTIVPQTFTYVKSYDTEISTPIWGVFDTAMSTPTITFATQASNDDSAFDSAVAVSTGSIITSAQKRYLRVNMSFNHDDSSLPGTTDYNIDNFDFKAGSSGTYVSAVTTIGDLISSWGPVSIVDSPSQGSIAYQFNASANPTIDSFDPNTWEDIVTGGVPAQSTAPYAAFRATHTVTNATSTVSTQKFIISWNEGSGIQPLVSWNHDRRFWLSYTTSTVSGAQNNNILIYQRNRTWIILDGINALSFATWRDDLYFGNSNDTGFVYKFGGTNSDDGNDISSSIIFKSYDVGLFNQDKDFRNLYVGYLGASAGSFSIVYDLDRAGTTYSLGSANMNEGTGQVAAKFPFSLSNPVQGREIQYTLTKSGTGDRLRLYDLKTILMLKEAR